MIGFNTMHL